MKTIRHYFRKFFEIELPEQLLYDGELVSMAFDLQIHPEIEPDDAVMLASAIAAPNAGGPIANEMEPFYNAPDGYYTVGFHEYGVNNMWFFYIRVDSWRRIYIRASYGGVYTDHKRVRKEFREYLPRFLEFEEKLKGKVRLFEVDEGPHRCEYKIALPDSKIYSYIARPSPNAPLDNNPLIREPDFDGKFKDLLKEITLTQGELPWAPDPQG